MLCEEFEIDMDYCRPNNNRSHTKKSKEIENNGGLIEINEF